MKRINGRLTYGLVLDLIANWGDEDYYHSRILSGVADYVQENDINLICFVTGKLNSPYQWEQSRNIVFEFIDSSNLDGLIVLSSAVEAYCSTETVVQKFKRYKGMPIVTIGDSYEGAYSVVANDYMGMHQIVDHLIEIHGCHRIAFIKGIEGSKAAKVRFDAYSEALKEHHIPMDDELIFKGNFDFSSGAEAVKHLLKKKLRFDSIVAANDNMAIGAMDEFHKQLGRVPHDIPIVGFDNVEMSSFRAMTTVNYPSYRFGRAAAHMLSRIIQGKKVSGEEQLEVEMVLRSSCGCVPSAVKNSMLEIDSINIKEPKFQYEENKGHVLRELEELNRILGITLGKCEPDVLLNHEEKLVDAFFEEYDKGINNQFLNAWNNMILWCVLQKINLLTLHDILSCIRKVILKRISRESGLIMAENMLQGARTQISDAIKTAGASKGFLTTNQMGKLSRLEEDLIANMDYHTQIKLIYQNISQFGINKCYIALYDNPGKPLENSRIILACSGSTYLNMNSDEILYRTRELLPEHVLKDLYQERFNVIVQALHQGENQLGFVIFGFESRINRAFDILRYRLSVALKGSLLIDRVKNQAVELEKKVIERTKELSEINEQLASEALKRKEAENKLRTILSELEAHNNQLKYVSIRDELTGLYNRRGFMALGFEKYEHYKIMGQEFMMFYADLDGLKQVNDTYGHKEGDNIIVAAAEILNNAFRGSDIIARLGGDEFTMIALGAPPSNEIMIKSRVQHFCDTYNQTSNKPYLLSISMGASYFDPKAPLGFEELLKVADEALYREKQQKKIFKKSKDKQK